MPFLARPGCDLYYETHGTGPGLVFAHGLGGSHLSWWQQVPAFQDRHTCVVFSHRGFGLSRLDAGRPGPSPEAFRDDLAALDEHLALPEVSLVAQSMGGWTCLEYALQRPERVTALVLACTTGTVRPPPLDPARAAARTQAEAELVARGVHPACGERMAREQPALHHLYRSVDALSMGLDKAALRAALMATRTRSPESLAELRVPVMCLTGEEDVVIPPESVAALARHIPGARLVRVPAAGHSVYWERSDVFNRLLDDFLAPALA